MSPSRPDIVAARGAARPLQRLQAHLGGDAAQGQGLWDVPVAELWLRHQPRKLVPDAVLDGLIAADRAQPAALLAELERLAAAAPTSIPAATLGGLHELAATIRVHGVLVPIRLARVDDRYVVEEGHRRSLATLLAGLDRLPAMVAPSASELLLAARQFVANDQRTDLSALEKAAWLRDLVAKADRELRLRHGWPLDAPAFAALFEGVDDDGPHPDPLPGGEGEAGSPDGEAGPPRVGSSASNGTASSREETADPLSPRETAEAGARPPLSPWERAGVRATDIADRVPNGTAAGAADPDERAAGGPTRGDLERHKGEVRAQVLSLTGLSLGRYYQLRQLNRLCAEARDLAAGLTERHLRPVVVLSPDGQVLVIGAILAHQVPANKVPDLVRALADGGEQALRRALAALGLPSARGRVAASYSRLPAMPVDWPERVALVEHELRTIKAPRARATRLAQLSEQAERLEALAAAYRELIQQHRPARRLDD